MQWLISLRWWTGMDSKQEKGKAERVQFGHGFSMKIIANDGSWYRPCAMLDVSDDGALLQFKESLSGLKLDEFFLSLSSTGVAFRRCKLEWVNGDRMGVIFIKASDRTAAAKSNPMVD
jgi:hypothetical protein